MSRHLVAILVGTAFGFGLPAAPMLPQDFPDSVVRTIPVGGDPHGITCLPDSPYAYVGNESFDGVIVVSTVNGAVAETVACGNAPWSVAASPDGRYVYAANRADGTVSVIRTSDNSVIATTVVGQSPHGVAPLSDGSRVYVANIDADNVSVIRTSDFTVIATVPVGVEPRHVVSLPDGSRVYTANSVSGTVSAIRTSDNAVVATVPVAGYPHRLTASSDGSYLYVVQANANSVAVVRTSDNTVVASIPVGSGPCGACALPDAGYVYVSNPGSSSVTVIRTSDNTVVATIPVGSGARAVASSGNGDFVYTADRSSRSVTAIGRRQQTRVGDVGVSTILAPAGTVDSGTIVTPQAVVRNLGADSAIFPVQMRIGTNYSVVVSETLPSGITDTVAFLDWVAQPVGTQSVVCFTALVGDSNPQNDTCVGSVRVATGYQVDVGTVAIVAPPASIESGGSCLPKALVRNFGLTDAVFPVTMCIDTSYRHTVQDTLAPGASDTVVFRQWIADPVGTHPIVCFTQLAGDQNTGNDTVFGAVRVGGPASHDVGTLAILAPDIAAKDGDTITPRALVHNFGLWPERYFDVRFRIGSAYDYNVAVFSTLSPDSTVTVTFPTWIAVAGSHPVSCSTMLYSDAYTLNDKLTTTTHVTSRRHLLIEPDQSDVVEADEARSFPFYAEVQGDTGFTVRLDDLVIPTGWTAEFYDSTGGTPVCTLGFLLPGVQSWFNLQLRSPDALSGDTALLGSTAFVVRGHVVGDSTMSDTAVLTLRLVPELSVHNFPNPLQGSTTFVIGLPVEGTVSLTIYNRAGELIRRVLESEKLASGVHTIAWDSRNEYHQPAAPGTYEYILEFARPGKSDRLRKKLVVTRE